MSEHARTSGLVLLCGAKNVLALQHQGKRMRKQIAHARNMWVATGRDGGPGLHLRELCVRTDEARDVLKQLLWQ